MHILHCDNKVGFMPNNKAMYVSELSSCLCCVGLQQGCGLVGPGGPDL